MAIGNKKSGKKQKMTSTKELKGVRRNGILYLDRGVGTGCFSNVNPSSSGGEMNSCSGSIIPNVKGR